MRRPRIVPGQFFRKTRSSTAQPRALTFAVSSSSDSLLVNPGLVALTRYAPGRSPKNEYRPLLSVVVVSFSCSFRISMVAPDNGSPVLARSPVPIVTLPEMVPVGAAPGRLFKNAKSSSAYFTFLLRVQPRDGK